MKQQAIDILDEMIELEHDKLNDLNPLWKVKQLKERKSVLEKAKSRISALWESSNDGWIPVTERLPEESLEVLTYSFWLYILAYHIWWDWFETGWLQPLQKIEYYRILPLPPNK